MPIRRMTLAVAALFLLSTGTQAQEKWPTKAWPEARPAEVGLDAAVLAALDAEIAGGQHGYVDTMLVIRCGQVAYERSYARDYDRIYGERARTPGPLNHDPKGAYNYFSADWHPYYRRGDLHTMQSVTKSVTSVLIGVATRRKEFPSDLDIPILPFFDAGRVANLDERKRRIRLRHLLTMTAGLDWNEDVPYDDPTNSADLMEASRDWVQYVLNRPMAHEPGSVFAYSSGATQLLSHIFKQATGRDIADYAAQHLFRPLGIRFYWKRTPTGLADAEGGLYLRPRDLAKIGYLFLKNGRWEGRQVVDPQWVKASVAPSVQPAGGEVKYGFQWWLAPYGSAPERLAWAASGFGGQRLLVLPEHDLIIVFTGWNILSPPLSARVVLDRLLPGVHEYGCGESTQH